MSPDARAKALAARRMIETQRDSRGPRTRDGHFVPELAFAGWVEFVLRGTALYGRGRRNLDAFETTRHEVGLSRLPPAFDGFRLLQLSDLHLDVNETFADAIGDALVGLEWDACVLTGDYRYRKAGPIEPCLRALERLRPRLGDAVYAILGNHDHSAMVAPIESFGIRVLVNEAVRLDRGADSLYVLGVDDPHLYRTDDLDAAARGIDAAACRILLAHAPEIHEQAAAIGVDLMLAGHTHGGQIAWPGGRPVFTNARCPRRLASGAWSWGDLRGYTSRGTGSSLADVRLNCRPEIVVHVLLRDDSRSR